MMSSQNEVRWRDTLPLSPEITGQYEGKYIIFSEDEHRVIGVGETEDEAFAQARASGVNGEWHVAYAFRKDESLF
jgi:glucose/arabinose dehydrogenase